MMDVLVALANVPEELVLSAVLVFVRVGAIAALLPGFGEQNLPTRVRLIAALALTVIVWPILLPTLPAVSDNIMAILPLFFTEALIGLSFGITVRFLVMALQYAGSMAAQATALAQIMGAGATPDPMPAIGNILTISGIALALAAGLHIKVVSSIAETYAVFPLGVVANPPELAGWGLSHAARAASLAFTLSAPFLIASLAYNLTLGVINRAMPQLMVAFIGAPAISAAGILILVLGAPTILGVWLGTLDRLLADPFGSPG